MGRQNYKVRRSYCGFCMYSICLLYIVNSLTSLYCPMTQICEPPMLFPDLATSASWDAEKRRQTGYRKVGSWTQENSESRSFTLL